LISQTTKSPETLDGDGALQLSEMSMKQKPISSQTTPILFQQPTTADLHPALRSIIWVNVRDFALFLGLAFICWLVITAILMAVGE